VAGGFGAAAAEVADVYPVDVPAPPEQAASPTTLIATSTRLALRHLLVNIGPPNAKSPVSPSGEARLGSPHKNLPEAAKGGKVRLHNHLYGRIPNCFSDAKLTLPSYPA
jgi:hypothetical protein